MDTSTVELLKLLGQYGFMAILLIMMLRGDVIPKSSAENLDRIYKANTELLAKKLLEGMETTIRSAVKEGVRDGLEQIVHRSILSGGVDRTE